MKKSPMLIEFADRIVHIKQLTFGSVVFRCTDFNDKLNEEKLVPIHITGFSTNAQDELILAYKYNIPDTVVSFVHPANCVFG